MTNDQIWQAVSECFTTDEAQRMGLSLSLFAREIERRALLSASKPAAMPGDNDEACSSCGLTMGDSRLLAHVKASPVAPAQSVAPVKSTCRYEVKHTPVAGESFWAEVSFKEYEDSRLNSSLVRRVTPPCQGMNCGCTDGANHSLECHAEHVAAIAGGTFVKAPPAAPAQSAEPVAQYQARVILDTSGEKFAEWMNVSPKGAATLREQYADGYQVRELFERSAPQPSQTAVVLDDERAAFERATLEAPGTLIAIGRLLQEAGYAPELRIIDAMRACIADARAASHQPALPNIIAHAPACGDGEDCHACERLDSTLYGAAAQPVEQTRALTGEEYPETPSSRQAARVGVLEFHLRRIVMTYEAGDKAKVPLATVIEGIRDWLTENGWKRNAVKLAAARPASGETE